MDESWRVHVACVDSRFHGIEGRARNVYSQFGEDGLVEAVFERIGERNKWCFEVGAADGEWISNTKRLREQDWFCLLVESNKDAFEKLAVLKSERVYCVNEHIGVDSLDRLLSDCGAPSDMDFGVIDIDGQDYWVWDYLRDHTPRAMLVEFENRPMQDTTKFIPPIGDTSGKQAFFQSVWDLGKSKGYSLVAKTLVNALFVKESEIA